jgi:hypothetical protein
MFHLLKKYNLTIDADQQQQEAASPRLVVARSSLRYVCFEAADLLSGPLDRRSSGL